MIRAAIVLTCLALPVQAADFEFCWIGNNGFAMSGTMSVQDQALNRTLVTESDVTAFTITGTQNGGPVGKWSLQNLSASTSWNLNFDPAAMAFVTGGFSTSNEGQQWNASGSVNTCGEAGFGFNSGASGQDVCIDNTWRGDSTILAATPLPVFPIGAGPPCSIAPLLGALTPSTLSAT